MGSQQRPCPRRKGNLNSNKRFDGTKEEPPDQERDSEVEESLEDTGPMRSRRGDTLCPFGGLDRIFLSKSGGVQHTKEWQGTKRPMSGPSLRQRSRTHAGWSGYRGEPARCLPRSLAHLKREISEKKWAEARRHRVRCLTDLSGP
jgi:hypothetical protein